MLEDLIDWFKSNGGHLHKSLYLKEVDGLRGFYTSEKIKKDTILATCPEKLSFGEKDDDYTTILHKLIIEKHKNEKSFHFNYINILPTLDDFKKSHSFFFNPEELKIIKTLSPSVFNIANTSITTRENVQKKIIEKDSTITSEDIIWAYLIVSTRAWSPFTLLPLVDLFNHNTKRGNAKAYDAELNRHILSSKVDYEAGDQIFISYGLQDCVNLALNYGFFNKDDDNNLVIKDLLYKGTTPLRYAVGNLLQDYHFNTSIINNTINCQMTTKSGSFYFNKKDITSQNTLKILKTLAIKDYSELQKKEGNLLNTYIIISDILNASVSKINLDLVDMKYIPNSLKILTDALKCKLEIKEKVDNWMKQSLLKQAKIL